MTREPAIIGLARYRARRAIEARIRASGHKLWDFTASDLREAADVHLTTHWEECAAWAAEAIERDPKLQRMCRNPTDRK
jgi:hypothetical protein